MTAEPSADSSGAAAAGPFDRPMADLGRWSVGTLVGLLWCAALLIGWRRVAGALNRPLEALVLLAVGGLVAAVAVGLRIWWHRLPAEYRTSRRDWLIMLLPSAAVLSLGAALSLRGTGTWGLVVFWATLVGEELWAWRPAVWRRLPGRRKPAPGSRSIRVDAVAKPSPHATLAAVAESLPGEDVLQQLTRSRAADGSEQLSGWLRTPFAAGQRTAVVHLAFCPQFAKAPELTVEKLDGPEIMRINRAVYSFGARLDLKLAAPAEEPLGVLLQFSARSKPPAPPTTARRGTR